MKALGDIMLKHITVLKKETVDGLNIKKNGIYVDATLGGGGHSEAILEQLDSGFLYAFDQDLYAIKRASERLAKYSNFKIIHSNFAYLKEKLNEEGITKIDGILFDLGLSSFQIDDSDRGFSYLVDKPLDMRMNQQQRITAKEIVNTYEFEQLRDIFFIYGEEKNASKIASEIIKRRPLETTFDLVAITDKYNFKQKGHSAKRVFQALRIEVNQELEVLKDALVQSMELLNVGGRMALISFHSLEDRIVKHFFKEYSEIKIPKGLPIISNEVAPLKLITRKAILPTEEELLENKRSHSAKLRVAEKNK
ncbi:Ribosomal RNA small subunit methyltransferase H [Alteracholeplasma palmae J233]|uniref:Ribosomal RNA small subunit methyltransferase H n=1 Tax=Alteracholeplasma palmae (strain ATCC 49389 / J233) TaxID=1318466 RepID=U4KL96_ALTPJ|nr:Ribosomal RNA small subunit methyltransferase H [Alteracholeplasma palmae J233]